MLLYRYSMSNSIHKCIPYYSTISISYWNLVDIRLIRALQVVVRFNVLRLKSFSSTERVSCQFLLVARFDLISAFFLFDAFMYQTYQCQLLGIPKKIIGEKSRKKIEMVVRNIWLGRCFSFPAHAHWSVGVLFITKRRYVSSTLNILSFMYLAEILQLHVALSISDNRILHHFDTLAKNLNSTSLAWLSFLSHFSMETIFNIDNCLIIKHCWVDQAMKYVCA